ncbi:hypothetical protein [Flavobacterium sp.]|jgi:hypothetical protein|uniref:hypothetical protein n=1 Tax=Flavobacterium sp. TaxID=239 RepID=UPI0026261AC2|nr:hypothetical protein [Flavobacterium sp.]
MNRFYKFCLFSFFLLSDFVVFAQPGDEDDGTGGGGGLEGGDPAPAPINGKLIVLLLFGLIFAFYKLKNVTKKA